MFIQKILQANLRKIDYEYINTLILHIAVWSKTDFSQFNPPG